MAPDPESTKQRLVAAAEGLFTSHLVDRAPSRVEVASSTEVRIDGDMSSVWG